MWFLENQFSLCLKGKQQQAKQLQKSGYDCWYHRYWRRGSDKLKTKTKSEKSIFLKKIIKIKKSKKSEKILHMLFVKEDVNLYSNRYVGLDCVIFVKKIIYWQVLDFAKIQRMHFWRTRLWLIFHCNNKNCER